MNVIVCVDDRNGLLFGHRRQSQDRVLREKVLQLSAGKALWMNPYSAKQFADAPEGRIQVDPDFLSRAGAEDYCFVEDQALLPWAAQIRRLLVFRWNRRYPGDFFLDLPVETWKKAFSQDFPGSSHEKITLEVYVNE